MLIKIDKDRYINSDHIVLIEPHLASNAALVLLTTGHQIAVPLTIVAYITQVLDANDAYTEEQLAELSLESRLAQFLRNQSAGQSTERLCTQFKDDKPEQICIALENLLASNTVRALGDNINSLYYHASNPILTGDIEAF